MAENNTVRRRSMLSRGVLLMIVGMTVQTGCQSTGTTEALPQYSGTLLMSTTHGTMALDLSTGRQQLVPWETKELKAQMQCADAGGSLFTVLKAGYEGFWTADSLPLSDAPVGRYVPMSAAVIIEAKLSTPEFACWSIDRDRTTGHLLYCGRFNNKRGIFCLDSIFTLIQDVTHYFVTVDTLVADGSLKEPTHQGPIATGFFLTDSTVLISEHGVYAVTLTTGDKRQVCSGVLVAISRDREKIAVADGFDRDQHVRILSLRDSVWTDVDSDKERLYTGCFAPDGKVYVYTKVEGVLDDRKRVWLYDLGTGDHIKTNLTGGISELSSLYWIDKRYPQILDSVADQ